MFSNTNNGTFVRGDNRNPFGHDRLTSQHVPIIGNSLYRDLNWTGNSGRDSYVPIGLAPTADSWPSTTFSDPQFPAYGGEVWFDDQGPHESHPGPLSAGPLAGMEIAAPVLEQVFPVVQRVLPALQSRHLPALNSGQDPGLPWQPSWDPPVRTAGQHSGYDTSVGFLGTRPEVPHFSLAASSAITERSDRRILPTTRFPLAGTSHSVQPSTRTDPVLVASSTPPRPRGERWDLTNTSTFRCQWTSSGTRCMALIAGDRRSVTSHLRDVHAFTCDGQMTACAWGRCTARMQRRNIPRHVVACHFEIKVTCPRCGLALSRADAYNKHQVACMGAGTLAVMEGRKKENGRLCLGGV